MSSSRAPPSGDDRAARPLRPRRAMRRAITHPTTHEALDDALVFYFPPGHSYTGEALLEWHLHGSPAVVRDVLAALADLGYERRWHNALRPAAPGEFTRRAFEMQRMDLTACEALDALLHAETTAQRRLAQQLGGGRQAALYDELQRRLRGALAQLEVMLDFADEDDGAAAAYADAHDAVRDMRTYLASELQLDRAAPQRTYVDAVVHGVRLALYGRPNVGKSSLLNALLQRDAAIVTAAPGTTRDVVEAPLEMGGFRVTLADTAGVRTAADEAERLGIERTKVYVASADLALLVSTPDDWDAVPGVGTGTVSREQLARLGAPPLLEAPVHLVINKMDLCAAPAGAPPRSSAPDAVACRVWHVSAKDRRGLDDLLRDAGDWLAQRYAPAAEVPLVTEARHRHLLIQVVEALDAFLERGVPPPDVVLAAEDLRRAALLLGQVTGHVLTSDQVLGEIFQRFCIGK